LLVGELSVNCSEGISPSLNIGLVLGVKVNFHDALAVSLHSGSLANNLGGVHDIVKDGVLDSSQRARTGKGSCRLLVALEGLSEDGALSNNQDMASREFLLQLPDKSLLNLIERFQQFEGDIQDNSLAASSAVDFLGCCDVEIPEGRLELGGGHLKVEKLLGDGGLELIGFL
jgi:hypothetical protein